MGPLGGRGSTVFHVSFFKKSISHLHTSVKEVGSYVVPVTYFFPRPQPPGAAELLHK